MKHKFPLDIAEIDFERSEEDRDSGLAYTITFRILYRNLYHSLTYLSLCLYLYNNNNNILVIIVALIEILNEYYSFI